MADHVARQKQFKNTGKHEEMRRRRAEGSLELRKQRKEEQIMKRRNVDGHEASGDDEETVATENNTQLMSLANSMKALKNGNDYQQCLHAVESIRRQLSRQKNPPIDEVIKIGAVPYLIKALQSQMPKIQFEAAWALTNITSGNSNQTIIVVNEGAIKPFVTLLASDDYQVAEQSAWALGNITGESAQMRDAVIEAGIVEPLIALSKRPHLTTDCTRTLAWTMSNLCRYKAPQAVSFDVVEKIAPALAVLIHHPDLNVVCDVCWALAYITDGSEDRINLVLKIGVLDRLVELASGGDATLISPSLRCLGNIVTGDDVQTQAVLDRGILQTVLPAVLASNKAALTREGCWMISNICAGNSAQIEEVLKSGLIVPVIHLLEKGDFRTQTETAWVIYNICSGGTTEHTCLLLQYGALVGICGLLKTKETKTVVLTLDTLGLMLGVANNMGELETATLLVEQCNGLDYLEQLQSHENEEVYQKALQLVEKFFCGEDDTVALESSDGPVEFQNPNAAGSFDF